MATRRDGAASPLLLERELTDSHFLTQTPEWFEKQRVNVIVLKTLSQRDRAALAGFTAFVVEEIAQKSPGDWPGSK